MGYKHINSLSDLTPSRIKERVENTNIGTNQEIIPEDVNQNKTENIANRAYDKQEKTFSKQVSKRSKSYKEALVRSNYGAHNSILS